MSRRFFEILHLHFKTDDLEAYSIDEYFIRLTSYQDIFDLNLYCCDLIRANSKMVRLTMQYWSRL